MSPVNNIKGRITLTGILLVAVASYLLSALIAYLIVELKEPETLNKPEPSITTPAEQISQPVVNVNIPDFAVREEKDETSGIFVILDEEKSPPEKESTEKPEPDLSQLITDTPELDTPESDTIPAIPETAPVSETVNTANVEQDEVTHRAETRPEATAEETGNQLLQRYSDYYMRAETQNLASIFDSNIISNNTTGKESFLNAFQNLFDRTTRRSIRFIDMGWFGDAKEFVGQGRFEILLDQTGKSSKTVYRGQVFIQVASKEAKALIQEITFSYDE